MSNEKFISLDNLKQYDEFLDEELNKIKDTVDKEFTFNVKYAESDEIGGAAIKAVKDETGENIAKHFSDVESAIAINKSTLGYQKKNLYNLTDAVGSVTKNGVTFTVNSDKTITVNGTATANTEFIYSSRIYIEVNGYSGYIVTSGLENTINGCYEQINYYDANWQYITGVQVPLSGHVLSNEYPIAVRLIRILSGTTVNNVVFKPMLIHPNITDSTFEPYIDDVDTRIIENKSDIAINKTTLGYTKKNLLKVNATSRTANGITFTVNSDKSVTLNGTSTAQTDLFLWGIWSDYAPILLPKNKYICSIGVAQNNTYNGLVVKVMKNTTSLADLSCVYPSDTINSEITGVYISIESGRTFNNYTIYPMIRSADITDDTYEPYVDDVDTRIIDNKNDIAVNQTTLGYQKKNIFNPNAANWKQPSLISIAQDGTITSTITSDTRQWTYNNADYYLTLEAGTYIFTSITETGGDLTYAVINGYTSDNTQVVRVYPNIIGRRDVTFTLTETTTIGFVMKLFTQTCKLMIRYANITNNTYEPYVDDVDTRIADNKNDIKINETTLGYTKKNLFNLTKAVGSTTMGGITFTVNDDKTITLNGTATATPWFELKGNLNIQDQNLGGCKYSTGLTQNADSGCYVHISYYDANWSKKTDQIVSNNDAVLNSNYPYATHSIVVTKGTTLDNVIVKPMIRHAEIIDDTFEPYIDDVDTRLKKCLPLSGGTMNNESKIRMPYNKNNDTRSMEYSSVGVSCYVAPATGWTSGYDYYTTETTPELLGSIGAFGNSNTFKYYYMGNDYQNPLFKVDGSGNGTFTGSVTTTGANISSSSFGSLSVVRSGSDNGASIVFGNSNGVLGSIGMTGDKDSGLSRWTSDANDTYTILDTGNAFTTTVPKANGTASTGSATTVSRSDHVHPLQTTVSGNAGSATKLTSSAGSATQPVYFSEGKPVNCTYTLNKSVPSNAVFTDTNTLMTQSNTNANNTYPLLLRSTAGTSTTSSSATTGQYSNKFYVNPSTGVLNASSFKTTGTQLLVSGSISASDFNGNNATGAKTLTVSITNLSNYSSVYLELGNESDGFICGHIPISYLLNSSSNYVYLIGSFTEIDSPCAWSKVKASGNNILIDSPQYDAGHYYAFVYPLSYKITKS